MLKSFVILSSKLAGNGKIDFAEFVNMMLMNGDELVWNDKDLLEAFHVFDTENKGYIMSHELRYQNIGWFFFSLKASFFTNPKNN